MSINSDKPLEEKKFHIGVKAIIKNNHQQILLMKEDVSSHSIPTTAYWDFPGGRMQGDEKPLDTLKREIEEETGITEFSDAEFITAALSNHEIKVKDGDIVGLLLMLYSVTIKPDAVIRLSHEHLDYEWVDLAVAKHRLLHKYPEDFTNSL